MLQTVALQSRRATALAAAVLLSISAVLPALIVQTVYAAPTISNRQLRSTSAVPGSTTDLTWIFNTTDIGSATNVAQVDIQFCDTPLGTCTTLNTPGMPSSPTVTIPGGQWTGSSPSVSVASSTVSVTIGTPGNENNKSGLQIAIPGFTNNTAINKSYFTRMKVYSDAGSTLQWEGVFAQSTSQTLTVNARVQERLDFCVGATAVDDATTSVGDCGTMGGTSVDIGNVENGKVNVSPVIATNGGSNNNGIAFIRTNAVNGASIAYRSLSDNNSGALKVPGAGCVDGTPTPNVAISTVIVDQCFNTSSTHDAFTNGTERFGMTIAGINCAPTNAYNCAFASGNYNLLRSADYNGNDTDNTYETGDKDQINGPTANKFAWQADPTQTTTIASSAGTMPSTGFRVIDNEALILKFAATAAVTTPTGSYSVQADFIATTTF